MNRRPGWGAAPLLGFCMGAVGCEPSLECVHLPALHERDEARFVAIGDTGLGNPGQHAVGRAIAKKCERDGCDMILLLGDNFYPGGVSSVDDPQWLEKFELPYAEVEQPFYAVMGNHDYNSDEWSRAQHQLDYTAHSAKWRMPALCYDLRAGPVTFIGIDTQQANWDHWDAVRVQGEMIALVSESADTSWTFLYGHHPYHSNGSRGHAGRFGIDWPPIETRRYLRELFEVYACGRVDAYFAGHDHNRQVLSTDGACPMTHIVSGAAASPSEIEGDHWAHFQSASLGFVYVVATAESIVSTMIEVDDGESTIDFSFTMPSAGIVEELSLP